MPPLPFFENRKKCPDLGKKGPDCVLPWVKFSIQNVVLKVSRIKNAKKFSQRGLFFVTFWRNVYQIAPIPRRPPARKNFWLRACNPDLDYLSSRPFVTIKVARLPIAVDNFY